MTEEVARLQYRIEASTARFEANVKRAERLMSRSARKMERDVGSVDRRLMNLGKRFGAVLGAVGAAGATRGLDRMLSALDDIGKTADRVGLTTEALQRLRSAAQQTGVNTRTLDMAMQRFSRRIAEARNGTGEAVKVIEEMGIALTDADGAARSSESVLNDVADAMAAMDSETDQLRVAFKLFDSEGAALVNTLRGGADELERMKAAARNVIADQSIRDAEALRTQIDLLKDAAYNAALQIGGNLASAINEVFDIGNAGRAADLRETIASLEQKLRDGAGVMQGPLDSEGWDLANIRRRLADARAELAMIDGEMPWIPPAGQPPAAGAGAGEMAVGRGGSARRADRGAFDAALAAQREAQVLALDELRHIGAAEDALRGLEAARAAVRVQTELENAAKREGRDLTPREIVEVADLAIAYGNVTLAIAEATAAQEAQVEAAEANRRAIEGVGNAISGAITQADDFDDALRNLAVSLASIAIQGAFGAGPLGGAINAAAGAGDAGGGILGALFNAKGNAFGAQGVIPFAKGGVVNGPTVFPFAKGVGLMGEAGPEAIMPLKRGPGGRLGVEASGGGQVIHVDARGSTDPAATEAAVRRAVGEALARVPAVTRDQVRRGQL